MKIGKKILAILCILTLLQIWNIIPLLLESQAVEDVTLSLVPSPDIDIALAKAKTGVDLINFEADLRNALEQKGVDTDKVNITAIETQKVNIQDAFAWKQDVNYTVGSIQLINGGRDVVMKGNPSNPGKNAIWIMPDNDLDQEFTFSYNIDFGDSFNAAGMLLRVKEEGNALRGYMLSFNNPSAWGGDNWQQAAGGANGAIWEFTYYRGQNSVNMQKSLKKTLSINRSGSLTVKATSTEIIVSGGGMGAPVEYTLEKEMGTGFGFFSDHYSHGCSSIGSFTLRGINLKTENAKKLEEVVRETDWREDSIKAIVHVDDRENEQLNNPNSLGELLTRVINDEIHFVQWGKDVNKEQAEHFVAANNNNGTYMDNSNYWDCIEKTAQYIKDLIDAKESSQYVILNETMNVTSQPSDIMSNTETEEYPNGRWKIIHDCEYYENNLGIFQKSGKYIPDMLTSFNKTGRYEVFFEDRNVNPTYIYVHRKPIAEIEVERDGNSINLISLGYDLDNYSNNRGIKEEEWSWRKVGETVWHEGKLTDITDGNDFLVQLRVKDFQDVWSAPVSKYITKSNVLPIASYKVKNRNTSIYETFEVVDGSYDPYGGTIVNHVWELYNESGSLIYTGNIPPSSFKNYGIGKYTMYLTVTNDRGMVSERFARSFFIIPDDEAPESMITPTSCDWTTSITVSVSFTDRLGSGFKHYEYAITESEEEPTEWSTISSKQTDTITINQEGILYLHIRATDNAGNVSEDRVEGPYKIDRSGPTPTLSYHPTEWVNDKVYIHWEFVDDKCGYKQVRLPDGTVTTESSGDYLVTNNDTYTFVAYDNLDNSSTVSQTITNIDKTPPEGTLTQDPTEWTTGNVTIHWSMTDTQSGFQKILLPNSLTSYQAEGDYVAEESGSYTFLAYDNVGNEGIFTIEITNIDKLPPTLEVTSDTTRWTNGDVNLHWKAVDTQSGLREVVLPDSTLTKEEEGDYVATKNGEYTFLAYDNLGNNSMVTYEVTNIDKIPPTLQLEQVGSDICWEMYDTLSGIRELVLPNGEKSIDAKGKYPITKNGVYTFIAYDNVGNERRLNLVIDDQEPKEIQVEITKETENMVTDTISLNWKILDEGNGFSQIVLPDGTYSEAKEGSYVVTENGDYTFLVYDVCGRVKQITIRVENIQNEVATTLQATNIQETEETDMQKPSISLSVDEKNKNQIHWRAEDTGSGVYKVVLPNGEATVDLEGTYTVPKTGMYTFSVVDKVGNTVKQNIHINTEIFLEKSLYKMTFMI